MADNFTRRKTCAAQIGNVVVGGGAPIAVQSMTNTQTLDTPASVAQVISLAHAGADIVRLTAQGVNHARNLGEIRRQVREAGVDVPLVADIHFNPAAAFEAVNHVEKVRINPGNFADPGRTFQQIDYTDAQYAAEVERVSDKFNKFLDACVEKDCAVRVGVNHGSLSDRIMSRFGNTPEGIVESALEFLRVCGRRHFNNVVVSVKASNVLVMVQSVRKLAKAMDAEHLHYPLHLGVTEAGDGEDGRIKSAVGIGTLLAEGIGDTIRVSLSEAPEAEIPVARALLEHIGKMTRNAPVVPLRRPVRTPLVLDSADECAALLTEGYALVEGSGPDALADTKSALAALGDKPAILRLSYPADMPEDALMLAAAVDFGSSLLDGYADAVCIDAPQLSADRRKHLLYGILQATRRLITRTEYIACPGCGRTLFDLPGTLAAVRAATGHLKGLKIGVMGCIVNGPGEMADADFGYVGAAAGRVSLYRGHECVERNLDAAEAIPALIDLIKKNGKWHEP